MEHPQGRLEWLTDAGLVALAVASRLPLMSRLLYDHDSYLFARAAAHYDLRAGIPHPPGYLFYVYLGKGMAYLTGDVNRAFIWVGILAGALTAVCIHHLGKRVFSASVGVVAALLYLFGPLIWFYHEIATSYAVEGFLSALAALVAWHAYRGSRRAEYLLPVLLGVGGGVRPWLTLQLMPLWALVVWRLGFRRAALSLGLVLVFSLSWVVPNSLSAGGLGEYLSIVRHYGGGLFAEGHFGSLTRTLDAAGKMGLWWYYSLGLALVGLAWLGLRRWVLRSALGAFDEAGRRWGWFFTCWLLPAILLRVFVHLTYPGYLLIFMPGLCLLAAAGLRVAAQDWARVLESGWPGAAGQRVTRRAGALLAVLTLGALGHDVTAFLIGRAGFSWPIIESRNRIIQVRLDLARRFPSAETVIFASDLGDAAEYYLQGYRVVNVFYTPGEQAFGPRRQGREHARWVVLFDGQLRDANRTPDAVRTKALADGAPIPTFSDGTPVLAYFDLSPGQTVARWKGGYRLTGGGRH